MMSNFSHVALDILVKVVTARSSYYTERFSSLNPQVVWRMVICHPVEYLVLQITTRFVHIEIALNNLRVFSRYIFPARVQWPKKRVSHQKHHLSNSFPSEEVPKAFYKLLLN